MWTLDEQTLQALGMRAQSVVAVSLSLGTEKPVTHKKAHSPEGFRQGSFAGLTCPIGRSVLAGPRWSKICRAAASLSFANNCLHCFPWGLWCHDFPNAQPFQMRKPDPLGDRGSDITGTSCLNDFFFFFFTSIWVHFLWSMTTMYSRVLETIRGQLIFHKQ